MPSITSLKSESNVILQDGRATCDYKSRPKGENSSFHESFNIYPKQLDLLISLSTNMENPSQSSQAQFCRNGCGFYGSPKTDGMCSICYKDTIQKKNNSGRKSPSSSTSISTSLEKSKSLSTTVINDGSVASAMASLATTDKTEVEILKVENNVSSSSSSTSIEPSVSIPSATDPAGALTAPSQTSSAGEASTSLDSTSPSPSKPKKTRCAVCRKRLGLTGFYCRCGNTFCSLHRYSDQHACQFDYKADAQAKIRKENPVVVGEKINKI